MRNQTQSYFKAYFEKIAPQRLKWKKRNSYYNNYLQRHFAFLIPENKRVLEIGCGAGDLLNAVTPSFGLGIDFSPTMLAIASSRFKHLHFMEAVAEELDLGSTFDPFDYIIISDLFHTAFDAQKILEKVKQYTHPGSRIIISNFSYLWELPLRLAEKLGLKEKSPFANWLSARDVLNLLTISDFQLIKFERKLLLPVNIPILSYVFNRILANLPLINQLNLLNFLVARPTCNISKSYSVSIVIPARNEKGNIENCIRQTPVFGSSQQFIFIEGNSSDQTYEEMKRVQSCYPQKNIVVAKQSGKGKGNAVREGFDIADGDVLMILDADLTTPPEDLPKFYEALRSNKGEFINGCRLVYPMEKQAMRLLNLIANKLFGLLFSYLLGQNIKDTLCGTKVLMRNDYIKLKENRAYFGDFDPFGDFDLLLGSAKLNLKIVEIYVRYKDREYGSTQISRFKHGWLLLKMSGFAMRKIKFV
jgi:ubiquinone/menaquinone biosynthesis C-methylase UbiE